MIHAGSNLAPNLASYPATDQHPRATQTLQHSVRVRDRESKTDGQWLTVIIVSHRII